MNIRQFNEYFDKKNLRIKFECNTDNSIMVNCSSSIQFPNEYLLTMKAFLIT